METKKPRCATDGALIAIAVELLCRLRLRDFAAAVQNERHSVAQAFDVGFSLNAIKRHGCDKLSVMLDSGCEDHLLKFYIHSIGAPSFVR
jgi:hypothetical protein